MYSVHLISAYKAVTWIYQRQIRFYSHTSLKHSKYTLKVRYESRDRRSTDAKKALLLLYSHILNNQDTSDSDLLYFGLSLSEDWPCSFFCSSSSSSFFKSQALIFIFHATCAAETHQFHQNLSNCQKILKEKNNLQHVKTSRTLSGIWWCLHSASTTKWSHFAKQNAKLLKLIIYVMTFWIYALA